MIEVSGIVVFIDLSVNNADLVEEGEGELSKPEEKFYYIVEGVSLVIFLVSGLYGLIAGVVEGIKPIGLAFVTTEFPPPSVFPLYMKPITWFYISGLALFYSAFQVHRKIIFAFPKILVEVTRVFCFVFLGATIYEVLFNFTLWGGLIAAEAVRGNLNPDLLLNTFPNPAIQWSLVFLTKMFVFLAILASYYLYFLNKNKNEFKFTKLQDEA